MVDQDPWWLGGSRLAGWEILAAAGRGAPLLRWMQEGVGATQQRRRKAVVDLRQEAQRLVLLCFRDLLVTGLMDNLDAQPDLGGEGGVETLAASRLQLHWLQRLVGRAAKEVHRLEADRRESMKEFRSASAEIARLVLGGVADAIPCEDHNS